MLVNEIYYRYLHDKSGVVLAWAGFLGRLGRLPTPRSLPRLVLFARKEIIMIRWYRSYLPMEKGQVTLIYNWNMPQIVVSTHSLHPWLARKPLLHTVFWYFASHKVTMFRGLFTQKRGQSKRDKLEIDCFYLADSLYGSTCNWLCSQAYSLRPLIGPSQLSNLLSFPKTSHVG